LLELDDPSLEDDTPSGLVAVTHATVIPAFDPLQFAEDSEIRARMPTITDECALEQARLKSLPTNRPPPRRPPSTLPPPRVANPRDSSAEIDVGEDDLDTLAVDEQVAILRAHLTPLTRVPVLARPIKELAATLKDPKTAYVIGFVDGLLPLDTIIDVTGLPELDTLHVLDRLVAQGIVIFRNRVVKC
jgi:hypothetical protein